jgi:hypothetical protein
MMTAMLSIIFDFFPLMNLSIFCLSPLRDPKLSPAIAVCIRCKIVF